MLFEHQIAALEKLRNGSVLVGGVGTGKSRTALAYYYTKVMDGVIDSNGEIIDEPSTHVPLYIITTAKKRDSAEWEKELAYFLLNTEDRVVASVTIDSWNNIEKYKSVNNAFFIFDEQRVPGKGAWARNFIKIAKKNRWILLTATPGDTWMDYIPIFIANGYYKNRSEFIHKHVVYKTYAKFPIIDHFTNVDDLYYLKRKACVSMHMAKKTIPVDLYLNVDYDADKYKTCIVKRWDIERDEPLANISRTLYLARKIINSDVDRILAVESVLSETPKCIIFYNFDYELEILRTICENKSIPYSEWNGHKHEDILTGDRWVYLVQYSAGAEGWECIKTDHILFYSQTYSYKTLAQAKGRIDRLNTPYDKLYYIHLISNAPLERAIRNCLKKKENFNEGRYMRHGDNGG